MNKSCKLQFNTSERRFSSSEIEISLTVAYEVYIYAILLSHRYLAISSIAKGNAIPTSTPLPGPPGIEAVLPRLMQTLEMVSHFPSSYVEVLWGLSREGYTCLIGSNLFNWIFHQGTVKHFQ